MPFRFVSHDRLVVHEPSQERDHIFLLQVSYNRRCNTFGKIERETPTRLAANQQMHVLACVNRVTSRESVGSVGLSLHWRCCCRETAIRAHRSRQVSHFALSMPIISSTGNPLPYFLAITIPSIKIASASISRTTDLPHRHHSPPRKRASLLSTAATIDIEQDKSKSGLVCNAVHLLKIASSLSYPQNHGLHTGTGLAHTATKHASLSPIVRRRVSGRFFEPTITVLRTSGPQQHAAS